MTVSFILSPYNQQFVASHIQRTGIKKSKIMNDALDLYRKYVIAEDLKEAFSNQTDEDVAEAMSDFGDYLKIVDSEE